MYYNSKQKYLYEKNVLFQANILPTKTEKMTMKKAIEAYSWGSMFGCFAALIWMLTFLAWPGANIFSTGIMQAGGPDMSGWFLVTLIILIESLLLLVISLCLWKSTKMLLSMSGLIITYTFIGMTKFIPTDFTPILFEPYIEYAIADFLAKWSILAVFVISLISLIAVSRQEYSKFKPKMWVLPQQWKRNPKNDFQKLVEERNVDIELFSI